MLCLSRVYRAFVSRMVSHKAVNSLIRVCHAEGIALHTFLLSSRCSLSRVIPVEWGAAGSGLSSWGIIAVVVFVQIAWNATNDLYELT